MKEGKVAKTAVRIKCLKMSKTITESFVFVDFYPDYNEPGSSHLDLILGGAYLSESSSRVWDYMRGLN